MTWNLILLDLNWDLLGLHFPESVYNLGLDLELNAQDLRLVGSHFKIDLRLVALLDVCLASGLGSQEMFN